MARELNKIIIHCSDSDYPRHDNIETIKEWHIQRGFKDIGYHFVITRDGVVHNGRKILTAGAHCLGQNSDSIGVCLTGKSKFTPQQFYALSGLCEILCELTGITKEEIYPHNHFDENKTCPNFDIEIIKENIK